MGRRKKDHIENVFFDNNILSRILKSGYDTALPKVSEALKAQSLCGIEDQKTTIICTASNIFEYCGFKKNELLKPEELRTICNIPDPGDSNTYFEKVFKSLESRVEQAITVANVIAKLERQLVGLPKDSQAFVRYFFINPIKEKPERVKEISQDAALHLFFGAPILTKYAKEHHIQSVRFSFHYFKQGHTVSAGKILPAIWKNMRTTKASNVIPPKAKNAIDGLIALHDIGDFLDSDLIHLAVAGVFNRSKGISRPVYCLSQDPPQKLKQRALLYKSMLRTILVSAKDVDTRQESREFKDIDLKFGHVVFLDSDFRVVEDFSVQTLKRVEL